MGLTHYGVVASAGTGVDCSNYSINILQV